MPLCFCEMRRQVNRMNVLMGKPPVYPDPTCDLCRKVEAEVVKQLPPPKVIV